MSLLQRLERRMFWTLERRRRSALTAEAFMQEAIEAELETLAEQSRRLANRISRLTRAVQGKGWERADLIAAYHPVDDEPLEVPTPGGRLPLPPEKP